MDPRIRRYCTAAQLMRAGRFDAELPLAPSDELSQLGQALQDLGDSLRERFEEAHTLAALTEKINSGMLLEEVLDHIYESCTAIIPYQRIGLALLEDGDQILRARWTRSENASVRLRKGFAGRLEDSSLQTILRTGRPRILNDLRAYLNEHPKSASTRLIVEEGFRSSLTCPLVARDKAIGFLFFSSVEPGSYADAHVELFMQIAGQVAITVEKGELYERLTRATEQLEQRNQFIRQTFGRYLNGDVVDRLLDSPTGLELGGDKRHVTILLSDLRGFTPLTEQLPPQHVIKLLNDYLSEMVTVVERFGGTIVEFIGDAILVVFGAPELRADDTDRAVRCAIEMQRAMPGINQANVAQGLPRIEMGVAVHAGEAIVGNIGSQRRTKYGVVGAAVNSAARLEGYTIGGQILITPAVRQAASCSLELGSSVQVRAKGLAQSLEAFELLGVEGGPMLPDTERVAELRPLDPREQLHYRLVDTERVEDSTHLARIVGASAQRIAVIPDRPLRMFSELCFCFDLQSFSEPRAASYARVIEKLDNGRETWLLHFTSLSPAAQQVVDGWLLQVSERAG